MAQNYAQQCVFAHNDQRTTQQSTFIYVGENLAITNAPNVNYTGMVRSWYDENRDYSYQSNSCRSGAVCGHYTQVIVISVSFLCSYCTCTHLLYMYYTIIITVALHVLYMHACSYIIPSVSKVELQLCFQIWL